MDRIRTSRIAYLALAWGLVVAIVVQVSLIGLWLFAGQSTLFLHKELGHAITLGSLALLILAFFGRIGGPMKIWTAALAVILVVQTEVFAFLPVSAARAFHPVLPLFIFALAALLARSAITLARSEPLGVVVRSAAARSRAN